MHLERNASIDVRAETKLPNRLRAVVHPTPGARACAIEVWIAGGPAFETPTTAGLAHAVEHGLFLGTARRSGEELDQALDRLASAHNGTTTTDALSIVTVRPPTS
jgi:predicted Zn-dependent peptidase